MPKGLPRARRLVPVALVVLLPLVFVGRAGRPACASYVPPIPVPQAPAAALALEARAHAAWAAGNAEEARRLWEEALRQAEARTKALDPNTLQLRGRLHYQLGDLFRVTRHAEASLAQYREAWRLFGVLGARLYGARVVHNAGLTHDGLLDDARTAAAHFEAALEVFAELDARDDLGIALNSLGTVLDTLGEAPHARRCLERALELSNGDALAQIRVLNNLGRLHWGTGEHEHARAAFLKALRGAEELGAVALLPILEANLGALAMRSGAWVEALDRLDRALELREGMDDPAGLALTLNNRALIYLELSDQDAARRDFERALVLSTRVGDRDGMSKVLGNLGLLDQEQGRLDVALEHLERSLRIEEDLERPVGVAQTLINIANVLLELERHEPAMELYLRAMEMSEGLGSPVEVAKAMVNVGVVENLRGRYEESIRWHRRALGLLEGLEAPEALVLALQGLGDSQAASDDGAGAIETLRRAVAVAVRPIRGLGEEQGARAREPQAPLFDLGLRVSLRHGGPADVLHFLETGRAGTLLEALGARDALHGALVPEPLRLEEATAASAQHAAYVALGQARQAGDLGAIDVAETRLDRARADLEAVVTKIRRKARAGADLLHPEPVLADEAAALLGEDEALVLLGLTSEGAVALVIRTSGLRLVALGPSEPLAELSRAVTLDDPRSDPAAWVKALRAALTDKLQLGEDVKHVIVSPHGPLAYVPFALLLPERVVSYVPSATTYRELLGTDAASTVRGRRVLALGDPDAGRPLTDRARTMYRRGLALPPLPGARREAKEVGDRVLLGEDATEVALADTLAEEPRWRAVHLVCHGLIDPERPLFSSLALTPQGEDDGLLTVLEVFGMQIPADLVTLSACETARGKVYLTEGIMGLTRAFMAAGSPRVLCSLWEVDDDATRALMTRFYARFKAEDAPTAAVALKEAQAWVRAQEGWEHPYYWAAWVLWGLP